MAKLHLDTGSVVKPAATPSLIRHMPSSSASPYSLRNPFLRPLKKIFRLTMPIRTL
jgi:hypothetical protein